MCALKVSLSTAKGKGMPARDRLPSAERGVRLLRLTAALSVIVALVAVVTILKDDFAGKSQSLIVAAIALGAFALVGMAVLTLPYAYRRKDRK
jgi:membrane protein YdbS with pleckstrin-like domain